ncbi:MAG: thiamine-phosphate kinase [Bacteroidetes bacterium]|nr:MAG: thiamine-phosphate kinase [Bacteroidota bacterium]
MSAVGEFGLIDALTKVNKIKHKSTVKAVGDDAAVIDSGTKSYRLITTDSLVEGVHFDVTYTPLKHLGYKSVVVNLSDIYAMNGTPTHITVALAISSKYTVEAIEEIYTGIYLACEKYNVDLIGGDTTSSLAGLMINISAYGEVEKNKVVYRSNAKPNDILMVSGDLGAAYLGLQLLEREKRIFKENPGVQPDFSGKDYLLERQLKPEARKDVIERLKYYKVIPTSMIDISDGLASEVKHLGKQSKTGFNIHNERIPIDYLTSDTAKELNLDPTVCALNGGEDYELLFTISPKDFEKVKDELAFRPIGYATSNENQYNLVAQSGSVVPIASQGWDAFNH